MKKLVAAFIGVLLAFAHPLSANAASYGISLTGDGSFSDSISISLSVYGSTSAGGACGGICGVTANLNYNHAKIELMSATARQGFDFTQGANLVLYKSTAANDGSILTLKFRNIGLADGESTDITIQNVVLSNGDADLKVGNSSKSIKYTAPVQPAPTPTPTPTPTPSGDKQKESDQKKEGSKSDDEKEDDSEKEDDKKEEKKSKNASLSTIEISQGEIKFDKDILTYDVIVEESLSEISITAKAEDDKAHVAGAGKHVLNYGANSIKIIVTAEDGSEKEYTINVFREVSPETMARHEQELKQAKLMSMIFMIISGLLFAVALVFIILFFISKKKKKAQSEDEKQITTTQSIQSPINLIPTNQTQTDQNQVNHSQFDGNNNSF